MFMKITFFLAGIFCSSLTQHWLWVFRWTLCPWALLDCTKQLLCPLSAHKTLDIPFFPWMINSLALGVLLGWGKCWDRWAAPEQSTGRWEGHKVQLIPISPATPGVCTWVIYTWAKAAQRLKGKIRIKAQVLKRVNGICAQCPTLWIVGRGKMRFFLALWKAVNVFAQVVFILF